MPRDVVTMNSRVKLRDLDSGDALDFSLVFPTFPLAAGSDHLAPMTVSVLAPIGTAVLGYRVGDTIEWEVPAGVRRLKVEDLPFQPESAGRYDLGASADQVTAGAAPPSRARGWRGGTTFSSRR